MRLLASMIFPHYGDEAQAGLAAVVAAGVITALPVLQGRATGASRAEAWALVQEKEFLAPFLATASVMLGLALFTNADRIVAQTNFGTADILNYKFVDRRSFDDFQAAGMLARAVLWGTAPLLLLVYDRRSGLTRTSWTSLHFFWLYLLALCGAELLSNVFAPVLSWIFSGDPGSVARFMPGFTGAVLMLGLLQGLGIFALASRRYPECFTLGGCSILYTLFLFLAGHEPQLMTACMFGGALISLTTVLLVGVVRYARNHP